MSTYRDDELEPLPDSRHDAIRRGRIARAAYWTALGDEARAEAEPSPASLSAWRMAAAAARQPLEPEPCPAGIIVTVEGEPDREFTCGFPRGDHGDRHRATGATGAHTWTQRIDQ